MGQFEKQVERIKNLPKDYTFSEAKGLLEHMGFVQDNKGKTSGSRVKFFRESDKSVIMLHKPHPGNIMKGYSVKQLLEFLKGIGEIK